MNDTSTPAGIDLPEPGVSSCYGHAWKTLWKYFIDFLLIGLVYLLLSIPMFIYMFLNPATSVTSAPYLFNISFSILISGPLGLGGGWALVKAVRGEQVEVKDIFEPFKMYPNVILATFLYYAVAYIWLLIPLNIYMFWVPLLLMIPYIIIACKLAFTPFLLIDKRMNVFSAIRESWNMTSGHALKVFLMMLLSVPINIAGALCFGVGLIVTGLWTYLAFAALYASVDGEKNRAGGVEALISGSPVS